jgi:hypothetical protein
MKITENQLRKLIRDTISESNRRPNRIPTGNITAFKKGIGDAALDFGIDAIAGPARSIYAGTKNVIDRKKQKKLASKFSEMPIAEFTSICRNFPKELELFYKKHSVPDVIAVFNHLLEEYGLDYEIISKSSQLSNESEEDFDQTIDNEFDESENYAGMFEPIDL